MPSRAPQLLLLQMQMDTNTVIEQNRKDDALINLGIAWVVIKMYTN